MTFRGVKQYFVPFVIIIYLQCQITVQDSTTNLLKNEELKHNESCDKLMIENVQLLSEKDNLEKGNNQLRITNAGLEQKNDDLATIGLKNELRKSNQTANRHITELTALKTALEAKRDTLAKAIHDAKAKQNSSDSVIKELQHTIIHIESLQIAEITRLRKKYETNILELEGALSQANNAIVKYQKQIRSMQAGAKSAIYWLTKLTLKKRNTD